MKKRKLSAIFLSFMLSAGVLAACSGKDPSNESKQDGDTVKIGVNLELSGNVASYGEGLLKGLELAVEEINKEGIDGKKIKLVKKDNKSDASEATNATIQLINQDKVSAIVGSATSGNTTASIQLAQDNKVPMITPSGTAEPITFDKGKLNDYLFRTCFIDPTQGTVAAEFASSNLNVKNAAILFDSSSDYAKGLKNAFIDTFKKNGGTIIREEAYMAKDTDFRSQLTNIKGKSPEFVYIPGYYEEIGLIIKQAKEIGLDVPFMGGDGYDSPTLVELAGADALDKTYFTNHYSSNDTNVKIQNFVKAFEEKNGAKPNAFNALGYDTGYLLADAIKRAGGGDSVKIKEALEQTNGLDLVTGTGFKFDDKHNPVKSVAIIKFDNGEQQLDTKIEPK